MGDIINLEKPKLNGNMPVEQAIAVRRSQRSFSPKTLNMEQIGQLAWAAQGQDFHSRYRTVPSAGATYPLEVYLLSDKGMFHYLPESHSLEKLSDEDLRGALSKAAWGQDFIKMAAVTIVFCAQFNRTTRRYGERGYRYVYMEAGHAAQNVHLQAQGLGLGSVAVGAFDDTGVSKVLGVEKELEPIYMVVVGYYRN